MKNDPQIQMGLESTVTQRPEFTDKTLFHVGVSGGKDSAAALLWMIHHSGIDKSKIVSSFCDITNDHPWTIAHVKLLSETVHLIETIYPEWSDLDREKNGRLTFFDLALHKRRFPSTKARFCTEFLKIYATQRKIRQLQLEGWTVIAVSGVRADESDDRKNLPEWDYSGNLFCYSWRPLIRYTLEDVLELHAKHNVPLNPLYAIGALRVGCWPCIMSRKSEIRTIALKFPERIDEIRKAELKFLEVHGRFSSFFPPNICPDRFKSRKEVANNGEVVLVATIDDVVAWSMTGDRAQGSYLDNPEKEPISCNSGFCE